MRYLLPKRNIWSKKDDKVGAAKRAAQEEEARREKEEQMKKKRSSSPTQEAGETSTKKSKAIWADSDDEADVENFWGTKTEQKETRTDKAAPSQESSISEQVSKHSKFIISFILLTYLIYYIVLGEREKETRRDSCLRLSRTSIHRLCTD